jgi:hypothetical protein
METEYNSDVDPTTGITDCVALAADEDKLFVDAGVYLQEVNLVEKITVSKTAVTSYSRKHNWTINKWVQTEKGLTTGEHNVPKIWLYPDHSGDETASWYVDVNYSGFVDSGRTVSGNITIVNTGDLDAVTETVNDIMGSTSVNVELNVELPYTLAVNETLIGTYSVTGFNHGSNEVTVTTAKGLYYGSAELIWGEPESEFNHTVSIKDVSDIRRYNDGRIKYSLCNAPVDTPLETLHRVATMRWPIEQCFEECKSYLGMGHCETRSYRAWYRHMLFVMIAHFLP